MVNEQERFKQELLKQDQQAKELMQTTMKEMNEKHANAMQKEQDRFDFKQKKY